MLIIETLPLLRQHIRRARQEGKRIALVPTMGNLHDGHMARRRSPCASRYRGGQYLREPHAVRPRRRSGTLSAHSAGRLREAQKRHADIVFSPAPADVYPQGTEEATYVDVPGISTMLEGASRPGHFRGVSTIVSKLFNLVQPDVACFGEKDFQQLALIRKMVADMGYDIEIVGVPIVRAKDGLALSSRNGYLTAEQRKIAPGLSKVMNTMAEQMLAKELTAEEIIALAEQALNDKGLRADDVQIRDADTLLELTQNSKRAVILVAAWLGQARLIDNKVVELA